MSRVIKFRAWDTSFKKWVTHSVTISAEGRIFLMFVDDNQKFHCFPKTSEEIIIQQFTGLLDKNSTEIYEGDIVKYVGDRDSYSLPGEVSIGEYFTHSYQFRHYGVRVRRIDMNDTYFGLSNDYPNFVVIGNIFENPELLTK